MSKNLAARNLASPLYRQRVVPDRRDGRRVDPVLEALESWDDEVVAEQEAADLRRVKSDMADLADGVKCDPEEEIEGAVSLDTCPRCGAYPMATVFTGGHEQCVSCKQVITSCCGDL